MKRFYLIALCAAVCAGAFAASPKRFAAKHHPQKKVSTGLAHKSPDAMKLWRPLTMTDYMFMDGEWIKVGEVTMTYDSRGNMLTSEVDEEGTVTITTIVYDENNMPVSRIETLREEDGDPQNVSKRLYTYDNIIPSFCTERLAYDWNDGDWTMNYATERNTITRNADGHISEIVKSIFYMSDMAEVYKTEWTYNGETGLADGYTYYSNSVIDGDPDWKAYDDLSYKNIVWENTDGQMTAQIEELIEGANRVKQADVYYQDELDGHMVVEYTGENDYVLKNTGFDLSEVGEETIRKTLDEYGSYSITTNYYDIYSGSEEPVGSEIMTITMDERGNVVNERMEMVFADEEPMTDEARYDYIYDAEGNPLEVTVSLYDEELEDFVPDSRTVYADYVDVAGIKSATADRNEMQASLAGHILTVRAEGLTGVNVYDTKGSLLVSATGNGTVTADLSGLSAGIYVVRANGAGCALRIALR